MGRSTTERGRLLRAETRYSRVEPFKVIYAQPAEYTEGSIVLKLFLSKYIFRMYLAIVIY